MMVEWWGNFFTTQFLGATMHYIEAPEVWKYATTEHSIFLAGGITGCPDWQAEMVNLLSSHKKLTLLNPRRKDFPIHNPHAAHNQILWEFDHLRKAAAILFWFPCETLCPIVLYELGAWSSSIKPLFIGVHPDYQRRRDVEIQMELARPGLKIEYSLQDLALQIETSYLC